MAKIRACEWGNEADWVERIAKYLSGEHSPQHALPTRATFVAVDEGSVVGFVSGHRTRRYGCEGELQWLNVIRERRKQGIAGRMLVIMGAWFVEQNCLRVCVDVNPQNTAARELYSKFGAVPLRPNWMVWQDARLIARCCPKT